MEPLFICSANETIIELMEKMVEGRGYAGRLEERRRDKKLRKLIEEKDRIIVIPDIEETKKTR